MSILRTSLLLVPVLLFAGCTKKEAVQTPAAPSQLMTTLEKADAQDGTVDQVISNCPGCNLKMPGLAENSCELDGYTIHFCKGCADKVKDPTPVIAKLKVE